MKVEFYNTLTDFYDGWNFNFLPFVCLKKTRSEISSYYVYTFGFGWLLFTFLWVIKNETDSAERKFKVGDFIKHNRYDIFLEVLEVRPHSYYLRNMDGGTIEIYNVEENYHRVLKKSKDGNMQTH